VRTFNEDVRNQIEAEMARMVERVAEVENCTGEFRYDRLVPSLFNTPEAVEHIRSFITHQFGAEHAEEMPISMGGEDFAEYTFKVPGCIIRAGIRDDSHKAALHHPTFDFNDEVIPATATVLAGTVLERLAALS
ncbi:MAG: M20/M25/M40 family metallo-hydrolase, partial [Sutterella wadsworthensis]|nr:M20/M25/M40 family metallo-hydrolase [Sutterella wadsworthensis]